MSDNTMPTPTEILLVADDLEDARMTIQSLRQDDIQWRVSLVGDDEGWMPCRDRPGAFDGAPLPDVIVLDTELSNNDGGQALAGIREDQQLKGIPVVILTGLVVQEAAREAENLQVAGFLTKPLRSGQFAAVMTSIRQFRSANVTLPSSDRSQPVGSHSGDGDAGPQTTLSILERRA